MSDDGLFDDDGFDDNISRNDFAHECAECGHEFDHDFDEFEPTDAEVPYYTHVRIVGGGEFREGVRTEYLCSSVCMQAYLEKQEFTEPKGDDPPRY